MKRILVVTQTVNLVFFTLLLSCLFALGQTSDSSQQPDNEPWRTSWEAWLEAYKGCVNAPPCRALTAATPKGWRKAIVTWEGTFSGLDKREKYVKVDMNPSALIMTNSTGQQIEVSCCILWVKKLPSWEGLSIGQRIRFKAVLGEGDVSVVLQIQGNKYAFVVGDGEVITTLPPAAGGQLEQGLAASKAGDYSTALRLLRPLAEQGSADAQSALAQIYYNGWGVEQDYTQAAIWTRKAAEQGSGDDQYLLGLMHATGKGVQRNNVQAYMWLDLAAGDCPAMSGVKENRHCRHC